MLSIFLVIGYLITIFSLTIILKRLFPNNKELLRKIIHIGIGPLVPLAQLIAINQQTAQYLAGSITILILLNYIYKLFPIIEDIDRKSYGTLFYCLSLFILISIYWDKDPLALITGSLIMSFGDGLAGLIGKNFPSKNWQILKQKKSLLGTGTMFLVSFIVIIFVTYWGELNISFSCFYIACIATLLEQFSLMGIDNFTVPIVSALVFNLLITNL